MSDEPRRGQPRTPESIERQRATQLANWQSGRYAKRRGWVTWTPEMVAAATEMREAGCYPYQIACRVGVHLSTYRYWLQRQEDQRADDGYCPRCGHLFADQAAPCRSDPDCPHLAEKQAVSGRSKV